MEPVHVATNPDIALIVKETTEIHVSSDVLRDSSKVFKAMLQLGFQEGNSFHEHVASGNTSLFRLRLPDDDPEAMKLLTAAMHSRGDLITEHCDAKSLLSFAILVDKYDCSSAIQETSGTILTNLSDALLQDYHYEALISAYLLDHADGFNRLTDRVAKQFKADELEVIQRHEQDDSDYLNGIYGELNYGVYEAEQSMMKAIEEVASAIASYYWNRCTCRDDADTIREERDGPCTAGHLAVMTCHRELVWKNVWQGPGIINDGGPGPLKKLIRSIESLSCPPLDATDANDGSLRRDCEALAVYSEFDRRVHDLKQRASKVSISCCLDCFRAKRARRAECRIEHEDIGGQFLLEKYM